MMRRDLVVCGLLTAVVLGGGLLYVTGADPVSRALRKAKSQAVRDDQRQREKQAAALQKDWEALQKDRQELATAMSELATTRHALKLAAMSRKQAREEATREAEEKLGLKKARQEQEDAHRTLQEAEGPVLEVLRQTPDYAAALATVNEAEAILSKSPTEDSPVRQAASLASFAVHRLERETLAKDPRTAALVTRLEEARTAVADRHREVQKAAREAPEVRAAERQFVSARRELEFQLAQVNVMRERIALEEVRLNQGIPKNAPGKPASRSKSPARPKAG